MKKRIAYLLLALVLLLMVSLFSCKEVERDAQTGKPVPGSFKNDLDENDVYRYEGHEYLAVYSGAALIHSESCPSPKHLVEQGSHSITLPLSLPNKVDTVINTDF